MTLPSPTLSFLDRLICRTILPSGDLDLLPRARVLLLYWALVVVLAGSWGTSMLLMGEHGVALGYYCLALICLAVMPIAHRDPRLRITSHLTVLVAFLTTLGATLVSGGLRLTNITPYFVLIISPVFLLGRRGYPWAIAAIIIPLLMQAAHFAGHPFYDVVPMENRALDAFVTWFSMAVSALLFVWAYEVSRESSEARKNQLVANVSHELRTPLQVLSTVHSLLEGTLNQEEAAALLRTARSQTASLERLVDDLLDRSILQQGQFVLHAADFDPHTLLSELTAVIGPWCVERGLKLNFHVTGDLPPRLRGDAGRLRQVLMNLTRNALKFTEEGSISLKVNHPDPNRPLLLRFEVEDTGIGIPKGEHARIFSDFYQVDGSRTREYRGTGLGLSICAEIVAQMGGQIEVDSEPDRGAAFSFEVEFEPPRSPPPAELDTDQRKEETAPAPRGAILIVEDTLDARRVLVALLERFGHDVIEVEDGLEALRVWEEQAPRLILMDLQMPGIDGFEATRLLRAREVALQREPVLIVAMTGHGGDVVRQRCLDAGMDRFLGKPFTMEALTAVVKEQD